jgi:hypothetical protein
MPPEWPDLVLPSDVPNVELQASIGGSGSGKGAERSQVECVVSEQIDSHSQTGSVLVLRIRRTTRSLACSEPSVDWMRSRRAASDPARMPGPRWRAASSGWAALSAGGWLVPAARRGTRELVLAPEATAGYLCTRAQTASRLAKRDRARLAGQEGGDAPSSSSSSSPFDRARSTEPKTGS